MGDILENLKKRNKVSASITLDEEVMDMLLEYKRTYHINSLSPMINEILKNWIKEESSNKKLGVKK